MTEDAVEMASAPIPGSSERIGVDYVYVVGCHQFWMWQGCGRHAVSTPCTAQEALDRWQAHLIAARAGWLLPWLERIAAGDRVEPSAIRAARLHRAGPE